MRRSKKFQDADVDVVPQLTRLKQAGADVLFMVANVAPSSQVVKSLDRMGWDVPIVSHWGPAGDHAGRTGGDRAAPRCTSSRPSASPASCRRGRGGARRAEEVSGDQDSRRRRRRSASPMRTMR